MRKNLHTWCFILTVILLFSCKKKDVTPPEISIMGDSTVIMYINDEYSDSGITYNDDKSKVYIDTLTNLKSESMGTYYYRYVVTDASGNYNVFSRNIIVKLKQENLLGNYSVTETISSGPNAPYSPYGPYPATVLKSNESNKILFSNFAGNTSDAKALIEFSDTGSLNIPSQSFVDGTLSGEGNVSIDAKKIIISYKYTSNLGTDIGEITAIKK